MTKPHRYLLCLAMLVLASCGSKLSANYTGTGTWTGTSGAIPSAPTTFVTTLYQSGSNISGEFLATGSNLTTDGTITGTVSGDTITATLTLPVGTGIGSLPALSTASTLTGTLTLSSGVLTGTMTGTVQSQTITLALSLTQQQ